MPWTGPFYYRSVRVNGQPRRQFVGSGLIGRAAAELDAVERERKAMRKAAADGARDAAEALDDDLLAIDRLTDALARAALVAAGCHQHHRGDWRRKREPKRA